MAHRYGGKNLKAWHTNFPECVLTSLILLPSPHVALQFSDRGAPPTFTSQPFRWLSYVLTPYSATEQAGLARTAWFQRWGAGYGTQQATRPQTLGYALADSPVGLLAWIYEKLVEWTDDYAWTDDEGV